MAASYVVHQGLVFQGVQQQFGGTLDGEPLPLLEHLSDSHPSLRSSLATKGIRVAGNGRGGGHGGSTSSDSGCSLGLPPRPLATEYLTLGLPCCGLAPTSGLA